MYSWDIKKALVNFEKHKVSFEEATTCFSDPNGFEVEDVKHSNQETRLKRLAISQLNRVLHVVFTLRRTEDGKETIRIIGARQANRKERKAYARQ